MRIEIEQWKQRAEKAEARCKLLEALNLDNCHDDTSIRKLVRGKLTDFEIDGDSYGVPSPVDIVESLCRKLEKAEAACVEMRKVLERVFAFTPAVHAMSDGLCDAISHVLSFDYGKGYVAASELDKTIYVLKSVLIYDKLAGIDSVKDEIAHLKSLRKESK